MPPTDRLPCLMPHCTNSILPATAAKTGGFCMRCAQQRVLEQRNLHPLTLTIAVIGDGVLRHPVSDVPLSLCLGSSRPYTVSSALRLGPVRLSDLAGNDLGKRGRRETATCTVSADKHVTITPDHPIRWTHQEPAANRARELAPGRYGITVELSMVTEITAESTGFDIHTLRAMMQFTVLPAPSG